MAREMGRVPVERDTLYGHLRVFEDPAQDPSDPLDDVQNPAERFGSYKALIGRSDHRFKAQFRKKSDTAAP